MRFEKKLVAISGCSATRFCWISGGGGGALLLLPASTFIPPFSHSSDTYHRMGWRRQGRRRPTSSFLLRSCTFWFHNLLVKEHLSSLAKDDKKLSVYVIMKLSCEGGGGEKVISSNNHPRPFQAPKQQAKRTQMQPTIASNWPSHIAVMMKMKMIRRGQDNEEDGAEEEIFIFQSIPFLATNRKTSSCCSFYAATIHLVRSIRYVDGGDGGSSLVAIAANRFSIECPNESQQQLKNHKMGMFSISFCHFLSLFQCANA